MYAFGRDTQNCRLPLFFSSAISMDLADLATGVHNVAVNTQDTRLARGGQASSERITCDLSVHTARHVAFSMQDDLPSASPTSVTVASW